MPREVYNEGRVLGYSTYELYVKHALAENPDLEPASEKEWLAAQIGHGTSMILKVPVDSTSGVHSVDFALPAGSRLATANVIIASPFFGTCSVSNNWATKVTDYGQGISNTASSSPTTQTNAKNYPKQTIAEFNTNQKKEFLNYMKIQDGVVLQPGAWAAAESTPPAKDFTPNLGTNTVPVVRLTFASKITTSFYVLLTGFTNKSILAAIAKMSTGSTKTEHPENGDFIGPEVYPWANKIVFMHPPTASYYLRKYIASGHENRAGIDNTDAGTARVDNLKIDHDEDDINTIFTSSYLYSANGISIVGPTTPGGNITIGAKLGSTGNASNYLKVTQRKTDASHAQVTDIQPSVRTAGKGVAYHKPSSAAEEVKFSSMIGTGNNYLKVEQVAKPDISNASVIASKNASGLISTEDLNSNDYGYTTRLTASPIQVAGSDITIVPPSGPGEPATLVVNLNSANNNLNLSRSGSGTSFTTTLKSSKIVGSKFKASNPHKYIYQITAANSGTETSYPTSSGGDIHIALDYDTLLADILESLKNDSGFKTWIRQQIQEYIDPLLKKIYWNINGVWRAIKSIMQKFPGTFGEGATIDATKNFMKTGSEGSSTSIEPVYTGDINFSNIFFRSSDKLAVGNLNIYSSNNKRIRTTNPDNTGDLKVN